MINTLQESIILFTGLIGSLTFWGSLFYSIATLSFYKDGFLMAGLLITGSVALFFLLHPSFLNNTSEKN